MTKHADAGYEKAKEVAGETGLDIEQKLRM